MTTSAIAVTGTLQRNAWANGLLPPVEQVRPALWSIPVPIPGGTMRYTNVYALESADGVTLVDAGWDGISSWDALTAGLAAIGHAISDVRRVLVTHAHRDHYGQAARIRTATGALLAMHPREAERLAVRYDSRDVLRDEMLSWMSRCGVPPAEAPDMLPISVTIPTDMPEPDVLVEDGELLPVPGWTVRAIWTPGHTPGHLAYAEERHGLLLSGDTMLPRITPNVSSNPRQTEDPLSEFLGTLQRLSELPADDVLPAHEFRFRGLAARAAQLRTHHEQRLADVAACLPDNGGFSAWQVASRSVWARQWEDTPPNLRRLALGETVAHLVVLAKRGKAERSDRDGIEVWRGATAIPA